MKHRMRQVVKCLAIAVTNLLCLSHLTTRRQAKYVVGEMLMEKMIIRVMATMTILRGVVMVKMLNSKTQAFRLLSVSHLCCCCLQRWQRW